MSYGTSHGTGRGTGRRRARRRGRARPARSPDRALLRRGKRRCRCHDDPPQLHGPYAEWTRKIEGKTVTRRLTPEQLAAWQPLFDNARKMRDLLARIQDLTLQAVDADDT